MMAGRKNSTGQAPLMPLVTGNGNCTSSAADLLSLLFVSTSKLLVCSLDLCMGAISMEHAVALMDPSFFNFRAGTNKVSEFCTTLNLD